MRTAIELLTIVPTSFRRRDLERETRPLAGPATLVWFPLVGAFVGGIVGLVWWGAGEHTTLVLAAALALGDVREVQAALPVDPADSVHVLADSIRSAAKGRGLDLVTASEAREEATNGVTAVLDGREVIVGKSAYVRDHATGLELEVLSPGESAVSVGVDGVFAGTLILSDRLRANAQATLAELHRLGVQNRMMLTGDAEATARHIAAQAGITDVEADLLPEDKVG